MDKLFGQKKSTRELIRENKRELNKSSRDIDKEIANLKKQEQLVQADIKRAMKKGDEKAARILAKQIVQMRKQQERLTMTKGNISAVNYKQSTVGATQALSSAINTSNKVMGKMNAQMDISKMGQTIQQFQKQNELVSMNEEMIDDAIDGMFGDDMEDEADQAMDEILDSIGIDLGNKLGGVRTGKNDLKHTEAEKDEEELEAMLARLKQ